MLDTKKCNCTWALWDRASKKCGSLVACEWSYLSTGPSGWLGDCTVASPSSMSIGRFLAPQLKKTNFHQITEWQFFFVLWLFCSWEKVNRNDKGNKSFSSYEFSISFLAFFFFKTALLLKENNIFVLWFFSWVSSVANQSSGEGDTIFLGSKGEIKLNWFCNQLVLHGVTTCRRLPDLIILLQ